LLIRPHFISIEDMANLASEIKGLFPDARVIFTGSGKNLSDPEVAFLTSSPFFDGLEIFDDKRKNISMSMYIKRLRKKKFEAIFIPWLIQSRGNYYKTVLVAWLTGAKRLYLYDLKNGSIIGKNSINCLGLNVNIGLIEFLGKTISASINSLFNRIKGIFGNITRSIKNIFGSITELFKIIIISPFLLLTACFFFSLFCISGKFQKALRKIS